MAIVNLTAMTALTTAADDDVLYIVDDPGGSPLPRKITYQNLVRRSYGEISVRNGATAQALSAATWTKLTAFTTDGLSKGTTVSHANDKITVTDAGIYLVSMACSYFMNVAATVDLAIYWDGSGTTAQSCVTTLGNWCASTNLEAVVDVTTGSTDFEVYAYSAGAGNITVKHATLNCMRIA